MSIGEEYERAQTHICNNPWLREPYKELLRLRQEIGTLRLMPGADDETLESLGNTLKERKASDAPHDWFSFLRLINGIKSPYTRIYDTRGIEYFNQANRVYGKSYLHGTEVSSWDFVEPMERIKLGECDHGSYYYRCRGSYYVLDPLSGDGEHVFGSCGNMLRHIIYRINSLPPDRR